MLKLMQWNVVHTMQKSFKMNLSTSRARLLRQCCLRRIHDWNASLTGNFQSIRPRQRSVACAIAVANSTVDDVAAQAQRDWFGCKHGDTLWQTNETAGRQEDA